MERIGRYEILRELGRGAMGVVYHARDPKIDREVAIKTIKLADQADDSEIAALRERLFREAQAAGKLSHPGIVTIYDVDEEDGIAYIAMEFVEGRTLDSVVRQGRCDDLPFAADVLKQTASALDYAHKKGIIHRDVKPANLMLTPGGGVKVMDFGIARAGSSHLTQTGTVMGTPSYMSPEQVKGDHVDGRSDQFSLGVIAYELVTGKKPFASENVTSVIFKIVSSHPDTPAEVCPWISPALDAVILKALSKAPGDRFADCSHFAEGFAQAVSAETTADVATTIFPSAAASAAPEADETSAAVTAYDAAGETQVTSASGSVSTEPREAKSLPPLGSRREDAPSFGGLAQDTGQEHSRSLGTLFLVAILLTAALAAGYYFLTERRSRPDPREIVEDAVEDLTPSAELEPILPTIEAAGPDPLTPPPLTEEPAAEVTPPPARNPAATPQAKTSSAQAKATSPEPERPQPESEPPTETAKATPPPDPEPKAAAPTPAAPRRRPAARSAQNETVSVYFRTIPPGAQIQVDGRSDLSCTSPCRLAEVPAGRRTITARLDGYRTAVRNVVWGDDVSEVFTAELQDARIEVLISSEPTGADIFIDGRLIPEKTNAKVRLPEGTYQVRVAKDGAGEAEQIVPVNREQIPYAKFILSGE